MELIIGIAEVARFCECDRATIFRYQRRGLLPTSLRANKEKNNTHVYVAQQLEPIKRKIRKAKKRNGNAK